MAADMVAAGFCIDHPPFQRVDKASDVGRVSSLPMTISSIAKAVAGILAVAAVATAGDFIWYTYGVRHTMIAGLVHGALLLTTVGGVLGAASGRVVKGLPIGTLAGIGGAISYYVLIAGDGPAHLRDGHSGGMGDHVADAGRARRTLASRATAGGPGRPWLNRGLAAAVLGGVAFYLVMTTLWGRPPAGGGTISCSSLRGRSHGRQVCSRSSGAASWQGPRRRPGRTCDYLIEKQGASAARLWRRSIPCCGWDCAAGNSGQLEHFDRLAPAVICRVDRVAPARRRPER